MSHLGEEERKAALLQKAKKFALVWQFGIIFIDKLHSFWIFGTKFDKQIEN